jgi:hypothetical protein
MAEKNSNLNDSLNKRDLEIILEVNKKAIEIETEVVEQNESIISSLDKFSEQQGDIKEKIDKIVKQNEEINKDLFKIQVLFLTGLLSLVMQVIQIFLKK